MAHYIATLKIERVDEAEPARTDQYNRILTPARERKISTVVSFVINEDTLINVAKKASLHLAVVSPELANRLLNDE